MPDAPTRWDTAFAGLPMEAPPADAWQRVAATLEATQARKRPRIAGWAALAAALALAVALPWMRDSGPSSSTPLAVTPAPATGDAQAATPTLAALQAESAWLEALLARARDGSVATGSAAAMAAELEARVAAIDSALVQPGLDPVRTRTLWAERVEALQALASFEGTRRWLAANGEQYDGVLVQVN